MRLRSELKPSDPQAISELVAGTGFFTNDEVTIAAELVTETLERGDAAGYRFVIAEHRGRITGYACFGPIPATASSYDLYWIAVHPKHQDAGLGRQLIEAAEEAARDAGATQMFIDTAGRAQYRPTRRFYERMGYHVEAELRDFYAPGDDKVVFAKQLAPATRH